MKVLIVISCLLAVATAGHLGFTPYSYPYAYGAQHIPVIGANGVPLDEPAVAAAKVEHAAAHVEAAARNGDVAVVAPYSYGAHVAAPVSYAGPFAYSGYYAGAQHIPVIGANGVPVDEPAVAAARANHAAAHVEAKVRNGDAAVVAAPVATYAAHGAAPAVPLDTPEVAAAKAAHFAAHVEAKVRNGAFHHYAPLVHYRKRRGLFHGYAAAPFAAYTAPFGHYAHYAGSQHIPVIGANGVPVDEPAVAAARAEHAAAHVEAAARSGDAHVGTDAAQVTGPVSHYSGPQHMPVFGANGVPVDEPAVAAARAEHAAAHVEAAARSGDAHVDTDAAQVTGPVSHYSGPQHMPVIGANGVPVDEPAVSAARANHAAAHVEAKVRNGNAALVAAGHFGSPIAYSAGHFASPLAYAAGHIAAPVVHYAGAQHVPVIGANGVPVDEPAVAVAKAHHAAAHVEAKVRNGDLHHFAAPVVYAW